MTASGSCLCGAIRFEVTGPLRQVIACHCRQCRKTSGHHVAASAALRPELSVRGEDNLTWYASSDTARRGFCATCGSQLFWDQYASDTISIFAGTLDGETGVSIAQHIFCADKGDYYALDDSAEKFAQGSDGDCWA